MRAADGTTLTGGGGGVAESIGTGGGRAGLARVPSSHAFGESGLFLATLPGHAGGAGATGGVKRARDRRADRRRKKDPFEALEERLLDGFSLESITKRLQQQDETLQKGVRLASRSKQRRVHRFVPGYPPCFCCRQFVEQVFAKKCSHVERGRVGRSSTPSMLLRTSHRIFTPCDTG